MRVNAMLAAAAAAAVWPQNVLNQLSTPNPSLPAACTNFGAGT